MGITSKQVYNINNLSGSHFVFLLKDFPNLNFTIQNVNLPGVFGSMIQMPTPVGKFNAAMDKLEYETLMIEFLVDESLNNWREVYNWLRALAPTNLFTTSNQYAQLKEARNGTLVTPGTLYILTNSLHINVKVEFKNMFPISLSGLDLSTQDTTDRKLHAKVQFAYDYFDISVNTEFNEKFVPDNIIS